MYAFALVLSIILCIAKKKGLITFLDGTSISNNEESCEQKLADAAVFAVKGRRATMEDRFALIQVPIPHLVNAPVVRIFAVLDGHGGQVSHNLFLFGIFQRPCLTQFISFSNRQPLLLILSLSLDLPAFLQWPCYL